MNKQVRRGILFVISAPAGAGKSTLVDMLTKEFEHIVRSISCTTRKKRDMELDGKDYFFLSHEEFRKKKKDLLEYEEVFGEMYGTPKCFVNEKLQEGKHVVLVIDTKGAKHVMEMMPCVSIFIFPPNKEELQKRLEGRRSETKESSQKRLGQADQEMAQSEFYDYQIINDDLLNAYDVFRAIIIAEEHRTQR